MNRRAFLQLMFVTLFLSFFRPLMSGSKTVLVLPKRTGRDTTWEGLEKTLNFRRVGEDDWHFYRVQAPAGYHLVPATESPYVRHLCDAFGQRRATVHYKEFFHAGQISLVAA